LFSPVGFTVVCQYFDSPSIEWWFLNRQARKERQDIFKIAKAISWRFADCFIPIANTI
jgi:hypothetical protein